MADIVPTSNVPHNNGEEFSAKWTLGDDETGAPLAMGHIPDCSLQFLGEISGATLYIEGTNDWEDTPTYTPLTDADGVALTFTTLPATFKQLRAVPRQMRARVDGGDESTALVVLVHSTGGRVI